MEKKRYLQNLQVADRIIKGLKDKKPTEPEIKIPKFVRVTK